VKSIIVYYSATGNTARIARAIHKGMIASNKDCDIIKMRDVQPGHLVKYDLIGVGGPIWGRETVNVRNFLRDLPKLERKWAFIFCTHGSSPQAFMYRVSQAMIAKGLTIIGYNDWFGAAHQLPFLLNVHPCEGHPDEVDIKEAKDFGREIAERAMRIASGETDLIPKLPQGPDADPLWKPEPPRRQSGNRDALNLARKEMRINTEKCTYPKCRLCIDTCPTNSLDFTKTPPGIKEGCMACMTCEGICPTGAIEIDYERLFKDNVKEISAMGLDHPFIKHLRDAESRGHFRWLIPLETVHTATSDSKLKRRPHYTLD
jgi:flavodoxin/ferredoxin